MNLREIEKVMKEQERNNTRILVYFTEDSKEPIATFYCTEQRKPPEVMAFIMRTALMCYYDGKESSLNNFYNPIMENIDNVPFTYIEYEFKVFLYSKCFQVWSTKEVKINGLSEWKANKMIMDRTVSFEKAVKKPLKPVEQGKGAKYVKHWLQPEVGRLSWGESVYDYYLYDGKLLQKYLWLKSKAGENKAGIWLKKNAKRCEKC